MHFIVYFPKRFRSSFPEGYDITATMESISMIVSCRTLSSETDRGIEVPKSTSIQYIETIPIYVIKHENYISVEFLTKDCRYSIVINGSSYVLSKEHLMDIALNVAQNLIEQSLNKE